MRGVRVINSWNLKLGILKLFTWTKDFNQEHLKQTKFQCWICLTGLSQEYWRLQISFSITSSVGVFIYLDDITSKHGSFFVQPIIYAMYIGVAL